ncbi:MAG: hypothetical protein NTY74_14055 [Ignavibacteriae bacterium]|nr:hypothetical protein [Ignavibacteriota bacterium]
MKKKFSLKNIVITILLLILAPILINAQDYYYQDYIISNNKVPRQEYDAFDQNGLPKVRSTEVVFIYLDFPDGRLNGNIPLSNQDLLAIANNGGSLDAVGEIGLTNINSPFPTTGNPNLFANLFKYKWSDRWNMLFSTGGVYQGSAHPDYSSHNGYMNLSKEAYGSFREYWKEVSNLNYDVLPGLTHSNETETMYRTGIANNIRNYNGERVIESIMLPLKKYDLNSSNGYFPDFNSLHTGGMDKMLEDAHTVVENMHANNTLEFDINNFNGIVVFVIAGSHSKFKGRGMGSETIVRGMYDQISSDYAVIDGITCLTHEFAHLAFGWHHTIAGRNCLMNPNQTKDINCPSHPNPILKLREGWATPIHLNSNLNNIELQPVETSMQVGIITIYGNPSAAPDHLSGECYVVENRRQIGFDKRLTNEGEFPYFKGGLLIWHYGPYGEFNFPSGLDLEVNAYKLITPNDVDPNLIFQSQGNQEYYFAYKNGLANQNFYNLIQSRTFSQENLKTGIQYTGIHQSNDGDINSSVLFNLSYNISLPPQYDYTVLNYTNQSGNHLVSTSGKIYFHKANNYDYFRLYPGAKFDIAPNTYFRAKGIKAIGEEANKIIFSSPGYESIN